MDLRKYIRKTLSESLIGEDYPTQFDMNVFKSLKTFKERIEYCQKNLKRLNSGSSRIAYQIDDNKVLKLAKNKKGIEQNETEIDRGASGSYFSSILAQIFDSHPDGLWVEMELARKINPGEFRMITKFQIEDIGKYLINFQKENSGQKQPYHLQQPLVDRLDNDEFVQQLREFVAGTDALAGDLAQISSYGIVSRGGEDTLVLIDFGITTGIYKDFYTESTLEENLPGDLMADYKKWKRKNVTLRGMSQGIGNENGAGARFGSGLYTASLGNKQMAKGYGDVYFVINGRPKNPVKFKDANQAEIWIQRNITHKNYKDVREFYKNTTIEAEMLKLGYDGMEVIGREIVNYKPENVLYFSNERQLIGYYEDNVESKENDNDLIKEKFNVVQNTLELSAPYDDIEKITIGNRTVYVLFGNVDYYSNKEAILAIKRKSAKLNLDNNSYNDFLQEFKRRFFSIGDLSKTDLLVSVETTGPINNEMSNTLQIPYIKDGFKKNNPLFKMKDIDLKDRGNVKDLFSLDFQVDEGKVICIMDDFITSGMTFKNAFDKLPEGVEAVGVCLFKLNS